MALDFDQTKMPGSTTQDVLLGAVSIFFSDSDQGQGSGLKIDRIRIRIRLSRKNSFGSNLSYIMDPDLDFLGGVFFFTDSDRNPDLVLSEPYSHDLFFSATIFISVADPG